YINNTGETPLNITAKDTLPSGLIYNYTETPYEYNYTDGANYYWNFTNIVNGTTIIIQYVVDIENCGFFENVINVTGIYEDQTVTAEDTATVYGLCPGINIVKDVNRSIIHPGETVTYTYTITNTGNCNLTNLTLTDDKIPTINYINGDTNNNNWLDTNETWTYQATTNPTNNITNTANITAEDQLGKKVYDRDTTTVTVIHPDIKVVKTATPHNIHSGDPVTWNIIVINTGNTTLYNVYVNDTNNGLINIIPTLTPDEKWYYEYTTNPTCNTNNIVNVNGTDILGKEVTNSSSANVYIISGGINVTKTANITQGHVGDIVNYTIIVSNPGGDPLYNVYVNDTTLGVSYYITTLASHTSKTYYIEHMLTCCPDPFINIVHVEGYDELGTKYTDSDTITVDIMKNSSISIEKYVSQICPESYQKTINTTIGENITFRMYVNNTGETSLYNITINDQLPVGLIYGTGSAIPDEPEIDNNTLIWNFTELSTGGVIVIEYTAEIIECGNWTNIVNVLADDQCENIVSNSDEAYINVECEEPCLVYNPQSYDFGYKDECEHISTTFEIWNGCSGTLEYNLSWDCGWITSVSPTNGNSTGEHDTINVEIYTAGLLWNQTYTCNITITSNGGNATFPVSVTIGISPEPHLRFNPISHDFGTMYPNETASTTFEIWNDHSGTLNYSLSEDSEWININPNNGNSTGEHDIITVDINTSGLSKGVYSCNVSIISNGGNGTFTVSVNIIEPPEEPCLRFSPQEYDFGPLYQNETSSTSFEIWNGCGETLEYSLSENCGWLSLSPTDGESTGEHDTITIEINTSGLSIGVHTCDIDILSNGGNDTFIVTVNIIEKKPTIKIERPKPDTLYFRDKELFSNPIFINPVIIGPITIKTSVANAENIERVEFLIDDVSKYNATETPYTWTWDEKAFFIHTIKVIVYDENGSAEDTITVLIINLKTH
ncbi:MAG: hypothetical protein DRO87_12625, partial [Candidatus Thorarchaeota archaeon]